MSEFDKAGYNIEDPEGAGSRAGGRGGNRRARNRRPSHGGPAGASKRF